MLAIEDVIDAVPPTNLHGVYLVQVESCGSTMNMSLRQIPLIILVGDEVLYGNLLKMDVWDKVT